jgi:N-glycosylase/DNA lyase
MKYDTLHQHYARHIDAIAARLQEFSAVKEARYFHELCFCLLAANTSSHMASRVMDQVGEVVLTGSEEEIRERLHALSCRFYNRRAHYIHCAQGVAIQLDRDYLVDTIKGFGYKEASHFLRNVGVKGFAILDKHVLRALVEFQVIGAIPKGLNRKKYLAIEEKMKTWSEELGIPMDELDFVLWSRKSGEILK